MQEHIFLAFTGLEEISKSQLAADVWTGFIKKDDFGNTTLIIIEKLVA